MTELKKVVGYKIGNFTPDNGEPIHFVHLYYLYPADGVVGLSVATAKCNDDSVLDGVKLDSYVELYFNDKKKCVLINEVKPNDSDLLDFGVSVPSKSVEELTEE